MTAHWAKIVSGGRLQVPAEIRRALSLSDGDAVKMEVVDGDIRVSPAREVVRRIQQRIRRYVPEGVSLSEELIADRRRAAADE